MFTNRNQFEHMTNPIPLALNTYQKQSFCWVVTHIWDYTR